MSIIPSTQLLCNPCKVLSAASSVRDNVEARVAVLRNDQIIENATFIRQEHGECRRERLERSQRCGSDVLQKRKRRRTCEHVLHHVTDVKETSMFTHMFMRSNLPNTLISQRHGITAKWHNLGTMLDVKIIQTRLGIRYRGARVQCRIAALHCRNGHAHVSARDKKSC